MTAMKKDIAFEFIDRDAIRMNNGDTMVDVSTAYFAVDLARKDEREKLNAWISVSDELPAEREMVLVKDEDAGTYDLGYLMNGTWVSEVERVSHFKRFTK